MAKFEIHRCLGRGGFGEVYRGVMSRGGGIAMEVAIKVLRPDLEPSSQGVQRLRDEGRLLGRLTHPTILRVYDLVVIEGRAALISEFVDGDDLARVIKTDARPPPRATFEIVAQVAAALDAAWSWPSVTDGQPLNLVHRDIKPDNIRLDHHGVVKLLDFGIAQASAVEREAETSVNIIMGSAQYLAPERMVQQEVGPESDVFALGCTLYESLTGEALFYRKSMRQMYLLMIEESRYWPFIDERLQKLDGVLDHVRARALLRALVAYKKSDRPTAGDAAARCDAISESLKGLTLRRWARAHDWPGEATEEPGPLEGRTFSSVQSLPAPEARTLELRTDDDWELPDPADSLTDPGTRQPVLGEFTARAEGELTSGDSLNAPWSGAELKALAPHEEEDEDDSPTVQIKRNEKSVEDPSSPHVTQPRFDIEDDEPTITPESAIRRGELPLDVVAANMKPPVEAGPPVRMVTPVDGFAIAEDTGSTDDIVREVAAEAARSLGMVAESSAEESDEPTLGAQAVDDDEFGDTSVTQAFAIAKKPSQGNSEVEAEPALSADSVTPAGPETAASHVDDSEPPSEPVGEGDAEPVGEGDAPDSNPSEPPKRVLPDDDYEPKPGDIDLSDTFKATGEVRLRVAPPGATLTSPARSKRLPRAPTNRIPVMLFSGLMGVLVGAVVISIPALLVWLLAG